MSYLWAELDLEIQSQAILEISTWSWAAPHSCHIHWVDWMKLSISLLFGFQWRQNLAMVLVAARWQGERDVLTVNVMMVMVVMLTVVVVSVAVVLWYCGVAVLCAVVPSVSSWRLARADWLLHSQLGPSWGGRKSAAGGSQGSLSCPSQEMLSTLTTSSSSSSPLDWHWHQGTEPRTFITLCQSGGETHFTPHHLDD